MHVLQVARERDADIAERWAKFGIAATYIPAASLLALVSDDAQFRAEAVDAIALLSSESEADGSHTVADRFSAADAIELARKLRALADDVAMMDGRKWSAIPIVILSPWGELGDVAGELSRTARSEVPGVELLIGNSDFGAPNLVKRIQEYRARVLSELDSLGFIVTYEAGRYRLGPALRPRPELAGRYYFGPADRRGDRVVTVDRDMLGIQHEVEQFEALINRVDVRERELQLFFEQHPHFVSAFAQVVPHVRLTGQHGKILIPDLVLKPLVAARRDSKWEVLELKLPAAKLMAGKGRRQRLSQDVWKAISQLREYGSYFADPRNEAKVRTVLGHPLKRPKLAVLIGRACDDDDVDALEAQQAYLTDVRIVTYDEILEQQKVLLK